MIELVRFFLFIYVGAFFCRRSHNITNLHFFNLRRYDLKLSYGLQRYTHTHDLNIWKINFHTPGCVLFFYTVGGKIK